MHVKLLYPLVDCDAKLQVQRRPELHSLTCAVWRLLLSGDDVETEFAVEKAQETEAELPRAKEPCMLPGWGRWASEQRKPRWMIEAARAAQRYGSWPAWSEESSSKCRHWPEVALVVLAALNQTV